MSFLKIGDRAAGAIKSGGTTRRAAKWWWSTPTIPTIEAYIDWKVKEEQKVAALVAGSKACQKHCARSTRPASTARARATPASSPTRTRR
jgi:ribonucleoside-diphosphate reductase alpha chain